MNHYKKIYMTVVISIISTAIGIAGWAAIKQHEAPHLPAVISKARHIQVVSVNLNRTAEPASIVIELLNDSDTPVIAVTVESGDEKDASGIHINGDSVANEPPRTIIEAHGTKTIEFPLNNLLPDKPFKVSGVLYADGTEDGEKITLDMMRGQREHDKAKNCRRRGDCAQP
jgi:hypothetical protein